jgi:hypothetical protein
MATCHFPDAYSHYPLYNRFHWHQPMPFSKIERKGRLYHSFKDPHSPMLNCGPVISAARK